MTKQGVFITFEGTEGCGKSTQIVRLAAALRAQGQQPVVTREPGGCAIADKIRAILLDPASAEMISQAELLLYAAARAQHVAEVIRPALEQGKIVLCDRFCDATVAYQGYGRGLEIAMIEQLNHYACQGIQPDLTLVLDLAVTVSLNRARRRNADNPNSDEDRFEQESLDFHQRIRDAYLQLSRQQPQRIRVVDADGSLDSVAARIREAVHPLLTLG